MIFRIYPASRYLVLLISGILAYEYIGWSFKVFIPILILCFLIGFISLRFKKIYFFRHLIPVSFFFLGIILSGYHNHQERENHITNFEDLGYSIVKIDSYTETKAKSYKVIAKVIAVYTEEQWSGASGKILLYFNQEAGVFPKYGEIYMLNGNLREIEAPKNPFEFDYKKYQARKNIYHHQFLRADDFKRLEEKSKQDIFYYANLANNYTHEVFSKVLDNQNQLGVAEAIIGGMRSELTGEVRNWYTQTGTVHALAVSGMHVGILFLVLNWILVKILNPRRAPFLTLVLILLWTYALFTGLSPSVCRATLMFSVFQIGMFIRRDTNYINVLLVSALILLMIVPQWIYDIGFQLSHLAVLGILVLYPRINKLLNVKNKVLKYIWDITTVSIAAQIYTMPLTLYYFQQFPNYFLIANPMVSLLCFFILPLGFLVLILFKIPFIGAMLGVLFKYLIQLMIGWVYWVYKLPFAVSEGISFFVWDVVLLFAVLALFQAYLKSERLVYFKATLLGVSLFFMIGSGIKFLQNKRKEVTFHFIPKGQGLSYIDGRNGVFFSSDSLVNEPLIYQYHLKNYYNSSGVRNMEKVEMGLEENEIIRIGDLSIYWIKNAKNFRFTPADITLVSNNSLNPEIEINNSMIVLDGTNNRRYSETMKEKYPELVVLYDSGSKTISLK